MWTIFKSYTWPLCHDLAKKRIFIQYLEDLACSNPIPVLPSVKQAKAKIPWSVSGTANSNLPSEINSTLQVSKQDWLMIHYCRLPPWLMKEEMLDCKSKMGLMHCVDVVKATSTLSIFCEGVLVNYQFERCNVRNGWHPLPNTWTNNTQCECVCYHSEVLNWF